MSKGPKLNRLNHSFTTRDSLGITGVVNSIEAELCPVINTVTPRAFYWMFMTWNYYDFTNTNLDRTYDNFNRVFLKKNDFFFVLSNIMIENSDRYIMGGKDNVRDIFEANTTNMFVYDEDYYHVPYGGMQYYNSGCMSLGYITDVDQEGNSVGQIPALTDGLGLEMAKSFEEVIKNTRYYKEYRLKNVEVPRDVLEELGQVLRLDLVGFDKCKALLRRDFFEPKNTIRFNNSNLILSAKYVELIYNKYNLQNPSFNEFREILFDYFSPRGEYKYPYPEELEGIIKSWEVVIGRQYFTISVELIWKYMLENIRAYPNYLNGWIESCLNTSDWTLVDINESVKMYLDIADYNFAVREDMISKGYGRSKDIGSNLENAFLILLSIYNRFNNRNDIDENLIEFGEDVSLSMFFEMINDNMENTVGYFLASLMSWIVNRHNDVAFEKMAQGRDGYFYYINEGKYYHRNTVEPGFQGIRIQQLMQVMKDLDMLGA